MRILIHTDEYLPSPGPCANRMKVFAQVLSQKGHQVQVLASAANKALGPAPQVPYQIRYSFAFRIGNKSTLMRLMNNASFALSSFFASLFMGKADVVITTSPPPLISIAGYLIAKAKGAKLVYDIRDIWPDVAVEMGSFPKDSFYARVFGHIARFMYKRADLVTTVSKGKVQSLDKKMDAFGRPGRVMLVSNGFDVNTLGLPEDKEIQDRYKIREHFTCVYIGNIGLAQGLDTMLDLARDTRQQDAQFLVFGDGADRPRLQERANREGLANVHFCGMLEQVRVPSVLQAAKVSYIPLKSASMQDSIPTKLYEALGLGCPVLLLAQGDASRLLAETGLGESVSPEDAHLLPQTFDAMRDNYQQMMSHQKMAMQIIRDRYSRQAEVQKLEKALHQLLGGKTGAPAG